MAICAVLFASPKRIPQFLTVAYNHSELSVDLNRYRRFEVLMWRFMQDFSASGGFAPWPGVLPLDPTGVSAPRPPRRFSECAVGFNFP